VRRGIADKKLAVGSWQLPKRHEAEEGVRHEEEVGSRQSVVLNQSPIAYASRLLPYAAWLTPPALRCVTHASKLTPHALRLTPHTSRLLLPTGDCLLPTIYLIFTAYLKQFFNLNFIITKVAVNLIPVLEIFPG